MERVQELIEKLSRQQLQNESTESMLATVQHLQDALLARVKSEALPLSSKVSVVMPTKRKMPVVAVNAPDGKLPAPANAPLETPIAQSKYAPVPLVISALDLPQSTGSEKEVQPLEKPVVESHSYILNKPHVTDALPYAANQHASADKTENKEHRELFHLHFDTSDDVPTLMQQPPLLPKELHETISSENKVSLNDRLKQTKPELAHVLKDTPIKDLRKAIGVNDKFLFVAELFRGDEAMYERSIKTINGFHILAEAEYWINRELKVKLGWNDTGEVVQSFYHLVRRRFS